MTATRSEAPGLVDRIHSSAAQLVNPVAFMEVCGTHTHTIARAGIRRLLPDNVRLVSGPGCPVCVTPVRYLDIAEALAERPGTTICTFGDMMRVPSSRGSLERTRSRGWDIRVIYSPREALAMARDTPDRQVVLLAVGFETTAPTILAALEEAEQDDVPNLLLLPGNKTIPLALEVLVDDPDLQLSGFLLPGHVSVVIGARAYQFLVRGYGMPGAIVGFSPADVLRGVSELLDQVLAGEPRIANLYAPLVTDEGNRYAQQLIAKYLEPSTTTWRGLGLLPGSGLVLQRQWAHRDASRIEVRLPPAAEPPGCRCGDVLKGRIDPPQCGLFARSCTPEGPIGACMVSGEGSCAAWYRHEQWASGVNDER